jgi:hypothetical protein
LLLGGVAFFGVGRGSIGFDCGVMEHVFLLLFFLLLRSKLRRACLVELVVLSTNSSRCCLRANSNVQAKNEIAPLSFHTVGVPLQSDDGRWLVGPRKTNSNVHQYVNECCEAEVSIKGHQNLPMRVTL